MMRSLRRARARWKYRNHDQLRLLCTDGVYTTCYVNVRRFAKMNAIERYRHYEAEYHPIDRATLAPLIESYVQSYKGAE